MSLAPRLSAIPALFALATLIALSRDAGSCSAAGGGASARPLPAASTNCTCSTSSSWPSAGCHRSRRSAGVPAVCSCLGGVVFVHRGASQTHHATDSQPFALRSRRTPDQSLCQRLRCSVAARFFEDFLLDAFFFDALLLLAAAFDGRFFFSPGLRACVLVYRLRFCYHAVSAASSSSSLMRWKPALRKRVGSTRRRRNSTHGPRAVVAPRESARRQSRHRRFVRTTSLPKPPESNEPTSAVRKSSSMLNSTA